MHLFLDIFGQQLRKSGEELCGDAIRVRRGQHKTVIVLSDGLGSGVKANILATLTAEILVTMLSEDVALEDVLATVIGTLPMCQTRLLAYATFSAIVVDNRTRHCMIVNFDNPAPIHLAGAKLVDAQYEQREIDGRSISIHEAQLRNSDFVALLTDGVPHAGLGTTMDFGWGWEKVAAATSDAALLHGTTARQIVEKLIDETRRHYRGNYGDDASCVGLLVRHKQPMILFTGPPLNEEDDAAVAERVLSFDGRKVVCGGTTGNIVARHVGKPADVDMTSMTEKVPPIAHLDGIDLMTEGILTMNQALELIDAAAGKLRRIPDEHNGASLLARELVSADEILMIVGQQINAYYQNPTLPINFSLRKGLVERMVEVLKRFHKDVRVEYV